MDDKLFFESISALKKRDFNEAIKIKYKNNNKIHLIKGKDVNFPNLSVDYEINLLKIIFGNLPKILKDLNKNHHEIVKLYGGLCSLWGVSIVPKFEGTENFNYRLGLPIAGRMCIFHARSIIELEQNKDFYKKGFYKYVKISSCNDEDICSACKVLSNKKYLFKDLPMLPFENCSCSMGCRCDYIFGNF